MTRPLRLDDEAAEELEQAASWYEARRPGLGKDFLAEVRIAFGRICDRPQACPLARDVPPRLGARRCVLRRFPYAIVYVELPDELRVVAIAHGSRQPGFWRHRL
ncbi:MAG TPA: type II toxin-antitoxin system RelE/ParE family toxin [Kofleriaceae bacterium]|nr:type II toxin-antitoxin system RelE/ParE family toxin [Kofleriaceae bacterium]